MTTLLLHLVAMPLPPCADELAATHLRARRLLATWRAVMGSDPDDGTGDPEDFWEMAARLDAALSAGADAVWLDLQTTGDVRLIHGQDSRGLVASKDAVLADPTVVEYGPHTRYSADRFRIDTRADRYHSSATFRAYAGRRVQSAGFDLTDHVIGPTPGWDVVDLMTAWATDGVEEAVIKTVASKYGIWRVPLSTDADTNRAAVAEELDWAPIHLGGRADAFLLQEHRPMRFEYRVFVVADRPVAGAGCVEEHTPLDNAGERFHPAVREYRGNTITALDDAPVRVDQAIADTLVGFARTVAAHAATDPELPSDYVLDVALDAHDRPLVVEFNALSNCGLYATRPETVTRALIAARHVAQEAGSPPPTAAA